MDIEVLFECRYCAVLWEHHSVLVHRRLADGVGVTLPNQMNGRYQFCLHRSPIMYAWQKHVKGGK